MDISNEIKVMLTKRGKKQNDLAEMLGCTQANIAKRLSNNSWKVKDLEDIADKLGFKVTISIDEKAAQ